MEVDVIENDNKIRVERKIELRVKFFGGWKKEYGRFEDDYRDYQVVQLDDICFEGVGVFDGKGRNSLVILVGIRKVVILFVGYYLFGVWEGKICFLLIGRSGEQFLLMVRGEGNFQSGIRGYKENVGS